MAVVTVAELRKYMSDVSLSANQQSAAQLVLDGVQQQLETYLNRPIQPVQVRERVRTDPFGDVYLSVSPVHTIISVRDEAGSVPQGVVDSTPLSEEDYDRVYDAMPDSWQIFPGGLHLGSTEKSYVVEYVGGYNGYVDQALKLSILEVASRTMTVNHDDVLTIRGDMAREVPAESMVKAWKPEELKMLERLRRRTVVR